MRQAKYIICEFGAIIFDERYYHNDIAAGREVISAGFVCLDDMSGFYCYGESLSLGIKSRAEDSKILDELFGWNSED